MYNDPYYSRRGRTIERKKTASGHVIQPELVPVYYNYFKDNGLLPSPPPAPPVHVDDGKCIAVDYDNLAYSFPSDETPLANALGTLLDNLEIDVDITKVDHIILSIRNTRGGNLYSRDLMFGTSDNPLWVGYYPDQSKSYTLTFVRDYSATGTVFYLACTKSWEGTNLNDLVPPSDKPTRIGEAKGSFNITRIVVATLTE